MLHHAIAGKSSQRILFTDKHKSLLPAPTVDMHEHSNLTLLVRSKDSAYRQTQIFTASTHSGHAWTLHCAIASKWSQRILFTDKHKSLLPAPTVDMHEHSNLTLLVSQVKPKSILLTDKHKSLLPAPTVDMHERSIVPLLVSQVKGFCLQTNTNLYCQHPQ